MLTALQHKYHILDATLTPKGKEQCRALKEAFPHHHKVGAVIASPLRRTIQTASLSFGPTLARKEVPFVLHPSLQEVSNMLSDTGMADDPEVIKEILPELFAEDELEFDLEKIDASAVHQGWNSKVSQLSILAAKARLTIVQFRKDITRMKRKLF